MTMTHLETLSTTSHSRKSHRVYRSPSSVEGPSPYSKKPKETKRDELLEMDAEDKEASTILMALSQHANRLLKERKASTSNSMSIRNLLDNERTIKEAPPTHYRRNSPFVSTSLTQRKAPVESFRHPNSIRIQKPARPLRFKSAMHVQISYRIYAHQTAHSIKVVPPYHPSFGN